MSCACESANPPSVDYFLGDSAPIIIDFAEPETGEAEDLAGSTLTAMVKAAEGDADADSLITKTSASGISLLSSSRIAIYPTAAESAALTAGQTYHLTVVVRDTGNRISTPFAGYLRAKPAGVITPS